MSATAPPVLDEVLPHQGRMRLLDRLLEVGADHAIAEVDVRPDALFAEASGMPAWVGLEYMAQAIAALAGRESLDAGKAVRPGLLLGSRDYQSAVDRFDYGLTLRIEARREFVAANGITAMVGRILDPAGTVLAQASLTVFQPDHLDRFLDQA